MSRHEIDSAWNYGEVIDGDSSGRRSDEPITDLDHEIAHLTKLRSRPNQFPGQGVNGKRDVSVSTVKMLAGRESNYSGRGRFSSADCCHVLSRYLPVNGPWRVDKMNSCAYVSQFSDDGSLFVAGFQVLDLGLLFIQ